MQVQAYRNLNKGIWSVRVQGKVIAHMAEMYLRDVSFKVSEKRRQAVIAQGAREVHAYVTGEQVSSPAGITWHRFTYNPYRAGAFVDCETGAEVWSAKHVKLASDGKAYYQP